MRITGGEHRSRNLRAPRGDATRPTSDRVRESLFAILSGERDLVGAQVLDLYAGTGALAFEALSRGAAHATLVESSSSAAEAIHANVKSLDLGRRARVLVTKVEKAIPLLARSGPFDLVLADPPYAQVTSGDAARVLSMLIRGLVEARALAPKARVVLEHSKADTPPAIDGLIVDDTRRYGDTVVSLYSVASVGAGA